MKSITVAIQTARQGSKSVLLKNEILVNGEPLYMHNLREAKASRKISHVFMSSDISTARQHCDKLGCIYIDRPSSLSGDNSSHYETIKHALISAESQLKKKIDNIVVLLGNNRCAFRTDLDRAIDMIEGNKSFSSVISAAKYNMFNPMRAYAPNINKKLEPIVAANEFFQKIQKSSNDKDAVGDVYFFNGSFWVIRREVFMENAGFLPFTWLGNDIGYIEQDPACMEIDASWQVSIVKSYNKI